MSIVISDVVFFLETEISFRALFIFPSNSTCIIDLSEILNFDACILSIKESKNSTGELARNPSLPLFKPIIGIDNLPISSADLKIVPSPPIETT